MASNLVYKQSLNQTRLDAITSAVGNAGLLRIYDGSQPASPDVAVTSQNKLAELTCGTPFAGSSSAAHPSVLTANSITGANASATGDAAWFRLCTSGGTAIVDGSAGVSGCDLNLDNISLVSGKPVSVTSLTITSAT